MAAKNANAKSWALTAGGDGRRHSAYPSGNAPSGGTAALSWVAPEGIAVGNRILLMSDGTHNLVLPANSRFTGFSQSSAADGSTLQLGDTQFTSLTTQVPKYSTVARGQGRSIDVYQTAGGNYSASGGETVLTGGATEVFLSYAVRIPSTSTMPEDAAGTWGPGEIPNDSWFKMAWLLPDGGAGNRIDVCLPTLTGGPVARLSGNGMVHPPLENVSGTGPDWWQWDKWMRITVWLKAGADPDVDDGKQWFEVCNTVDQASAHTYQSTTGALFAGLTEPHVWGQLNVPGWSDGSPTKQAEFFYTDIAIAWGASASARLEVGNAATYGACTDKAVCKPVKRHSGRGLEFTIERGGISLSGDSWLYYTDGNNTTTLVGKFT